MKTSLSSCPTSQNTRSLPARPSLGTLVICLGWLSANTFAAPILFTHSGVGSGSIGNLAFSQAAFTLTGIGDTSARVTMVDQQIPFGYFIDHTAASISIAGLGTFQLLTGTRTFVNADVSTVGFSRAGFGGLDLFNGPTSPVFATWNMLGSIGPVSGSSALIQWSNTPQILTDGGYLLFQDASAPSGATFQASLVPEPAGAALLLVGAGFSLQFWRRRCATRKSCGRHAAESD